MAKYELDDVFAALADPTRRDVVMRLGGDRVMTVSQLAAPYDMALPSFMKHLAVLEACGLLVSRKVGRVRECRIAPQRLAGLAAWIDEHRATWESRTDRLADFVERTD